MRETYQHSPNDAPRRYSPKGDDAPADPTLIGTVNHIGNNVALSHEVVDRIEMALFGPRPTKDGGGCPPLPDGLETQLGSVASQSAHLSARLQMIADKIGG